MTATDWYRAGWEHFTVNIKLLLGGFLLFAILSGSLWIVDAMLHINGPLAAIIRIVVAPAATVGWTLLCLRSVRGEQVTAVAVFDGFRWLLNALLASVIMAIAVSVGMVLFVIPGVLAALAFCMWPFGVSERNLPPIEALRYSHQITRDHWSRLFVAGVMAIPLIIAGVITLGLGMLVIGPWLGATYAIAYEDITSGQSTLDDSADYEIVD
mgnify:CR=1 FL=1|jgi:hypothetical protein